MRKPAGRVAVMKMRLVDTTNLSFPLPFRLDVRNRIQHGSHSSQHQTRYAFLHTLSKWRTVQMMQLGNGSGLQQEASEWEGCFEDQRAMP